MNNLAELLIKNFPKKIDLEDGIAITVRPLLKDDEPAFLAYFQGLAPEERMASKEDMTDPQVMAAWMEVLDYDIALPLIALDGDRIVGAALLQFNLSAWTRHQGEVRLSTNSQYRAKGLGTLLMQTLEDVAVKMGLEQLTAEIPPKLAKAFYLFEKMGFAKAAVLEGFALDKDGQESDIVLMIKSLAPAESEFHHT